MIDGKEKIFRTMKPCQMVYRYLILVLVLGLIAGCGKKVPLTSHDGIFLIINDSHPQGRTCFWVSEHRVFAQQIPFQGVAPDYSRQTMFYAMDVPSEILDPVAEWMSRKSEIHPPFVPEQSVSIISLFPFDSKLPDSTIRYFKPINTQLNDWLSGLRSTICKDEFRCKEAPAWFSTDPRFQMFLGTPPK